MKKINIFIVLSFTVFNAFANAFGSIQGSINDDLTNQPIVGAKLMVQNISVETNALGIFEIPQLAVGKYTAVVENKGINSKSYPSVLKPIK
ncbi:MAG: carboxypeptidase regulatory-like domain-containing protein [Saprospiraceae bacterium]|nr:carboxypeptidase regulatory-like domain-containing protein [Saprospiraceae bacterium]